MTQTPISQDLGKVHKGPSEEWLAQWREEMKRAIALDEPSDDHLLPEYIPLPEAEDEVVAEFLPKRHTAGKAKRKPH